MDRQIGWMAERPLGETVGKPVHAPAARHAASPPLGMASSPLVEPVVLAERHEDETLGRLADALAARHEDAGEDGADGVDARTSTSSHELACRQRDESGALAELPEDGWSGKRKDALAARAEPLEDGEPGAAAEDELPGDAASCGASCDTSCGEAWLRGLAECRGLGRRSEDELHDPAHRHEDESRYLGRRSVGEPRDLAHLRGGESRDPPGESHGPLGVRDDHHRLGDLREDGGDGDADGGDGEDDDGGDDDVWDADAHPRDIHRRKADQHLHRRLA